MAKQNGPSPTISQAGKAPGRPTTGFHAHQLYRDEGCDNDGFHVDLAAAKELS
jgi:hypothetical protein